MAELPEIPQIPEVDCPPGEVVIEGPIEVTGEVTIDNTCDNPVPIEACAPLDVNIVSSDVDQLDTEPICDQDTGTWWNVVYTNGVETARTDTGVSCELPPPQDIEPVQECREETLWNVWYSHNPADNSLTEIAAADTGLPCVDEKCGEPQCVKWSSVVVQMDNTGTLFSEATTITLTNTDGTTTSFVSGPHAGWSDQVSDIAAQMDAAYPGTYDPRCTTGCGGLLPPPTDAPAQPGIYYRYINGVHCPTDLKIPVKATATRANGKTVELPFYIVETPEKRGWVCPDCCAGEAPVLLDENMEPVPEADLPVCWFGCSETIPDAPLAACGFDVLAGNWCDIELSGDPDVDDVVVESEIIITVSTCGSEQTISYSIVVDGALESYEPVGSVVDCETGEEPFIEPPECPEGAVFEQVCVPGDNEFILDNSLWNDGVASPTPHLQNSKDMVIAFLDAAGNEISRTGTLANPYFNSFIKAPPEGCNVVPVCANHTSPKGCNATHVANLDAFGWYDTPTAPGDIQNNLTNPDQAELWASGWGVRCAGCGEAPAQAVIVDSNDPAWIGVAKNLTVYKQPDLIAYRAVTCDGTFWKDCDGNAIAEPAGGKCAKPCAAETAVETALDCAVVDCPDPKANVSTYINGRPPAGNPWSWGPYSAPNLVDFEAALVAAGYDLIQIGEKHSICPPYGFFGEDPTDQLTNSIATIDVPVEPNYDPDYEPADDECALQVVQKNAATIVAPEFLCGYLDGVASGNILATTDGPMIVDDTGKLVPAVGELVLDPCACECVDCEDKCGFGLLVGDATQTDSGTVTALSSITAAAPLAPPDPGIDDFVIPVGIDFGDDPDTLLCVKQFITDNRAATACLRVTVDHGLDAAALHTGFGLVFNNGTVGTNADVKAWVNTEGPGGTASNGLIQDTTAPQPGGVETRSLDYDVPLSWLYQGGLLQSCAFGNLQAGTSEWIESISIEVVDWGGLDASTEDGGCCG